MSPVLTPVHRTLTGPHVHLNLDAVAANTRVVASRTRAAVMAVVKADGYGTEAAAIARTALANGAVAVGVAGVEEALDLRAAGIGAPVLSWLNTPLSDFTTAVAAGVELAVPSLAHLLAVPAGARVHLHLDTGMARDGVAPQDWAALCEHAARAERAGRIFVVGLMSHLACAGDVVVDTLQRERFAEGVRTARRAGLRPAVTHLAATATVLGDRGTHHDLVRVGAALLGIDPTGSVPLRGAVTLRAPLTGVREVAAGTQVGYGHLWRAPRDTTLGLVSVGYADGVPRTLSARAEVLVAGRRCRVVGRVSMDQTVVDLGDLPSAQFHVGAPVIVFGPGGAGEPRLGDWARWSGRLEAELLVGLGRRVRRTSGGGEP